MRQTAFLFGEECKKILRSRYWYSFIVVFLLDMAAWVSEYIDRSRSTLYSTGVHVAGQGMEYLIHHEFGNFGVLVMYLLPLLLIASPVFADEYSNKMTSQIYVTQNGRATDTIVKSVLVLLIQFIWIIVISAISTIAAFFLFDVGITGAGGNLLEIVQYVVNIAFGCFCMTHILLFLSSVVKNTVGAMAAGFAVIILPLFLETESRWVQLFPVIGMQAECMQGRSAADHFWIWGSYICVGMLFFTVNLRFFHAITIK